MVFRYEYGEMNITKLNQRIDDIEDEIYREKLKVKKVSDELSETFDDILDILLNPVLPNCVGRIPVNYLFWHTADDLSIIHGNC